MAELNGTAPQGMDGGSADGNAVDRATDGSDGNRSGYCAHEVAEEWRDIPDWPYQVSSLGRIRRVHVVSPSKTSKRYSRVILSRGRRNGVRSRDTERAFFVHRLVAEAFIGLCPPDKSHVAHIDGDPQNNAPSNLYWATPTDNARDRLRHGTYASGQDHHMARINDDDARIMRAWFHIGGETIASISRRYMTTERIVSGVVNGHTYKSAGGYGI